MQNRAYDYPEQASGKAKKRASPDLFRVNRVERKKHFTSNVLTHIGDIKRNKRDIDPKCIHTPYLSSALGDGNVLLVFLHRLALRGGHDISLLGEKFSSDHGWCSFPRREIFPKFPANLSAVGRENNTQRLRGSEARSGDWRWTRLEIHPGGPVHGSSG